MEVVVFYCRKPTKPSLCDGATTAAICIFNTRNNIDESSKNPAA